MSNSVYILYTVIEVSVVVVVCGRGYCQVCKSDLSESS